MAKRDGEKVVIQCKRYRNTAVGEPTMRDLYGTMQHESADRAYLVTTGYLTPAAINWTQGKPIEIWDGRYLGNMGLATGVSALSDLDPSEPGDSTADALSPRCPRCELRLVEKRNRRTGEVFLGCPAYPECRYTRPVAPVTP